MGQTIEPRGVVTTTPKTTVVMVEMSEPDIVGPHIVREPPTREEPTDCPFMVEFMPGSYVTRNGDVFSKDSSGQVYKRKVSSGRVHIKKENGAHTSRLVKTLVAKHFLPNPANLSRVKAIDGNIENPRVDNLRWTGFASSRVLRSRATRAENFPWRYKEIFTPSKGQFVMTLESKV